MANHGKLIAPIAQDTDDVFISDEVRLCAKEMVNETEDGRIEGLKELRQHIIDSDIISECYGGCYFLQFFLRRAKYDLTKAKLDLDKFLTNMTKYPQWFSNINLDDHTVRRYYTDGIGYLLAECDKRGRRVFIFQPGLLPLTDINIDHMFKSLIGAAFVHFFIEPESTIRGATLVIDCTNLTLSYAHTVNIAEFLEAMMTGIVTLRGMFKTVITVGMQSFYSTCYNMCKFLLSNKAQQRIVFVTSWDDLEHYGINLESLPVECGGKVPKPQLSHMLLEEIDSFPKYFFKEVWQQMGVQKTVANTAQPNSSRKISVTVPLLNLLVKTFVPKPKELQNQ